MKIANFFLILLISPALSVSAQKVVRKGVTPAGIQKSETRAPYFNIDQLKGKWLEWRRTDISSGEKLRFTDSLMLDFHKRDSVTVRDGVSMTMAGQAVITKPNELMLAGDIYTIDALNKNSLIINDGQYIRRLKKIKAFYFDSYGNRKIPAEEYKMPVKASLEKLTGDWDIYRRQAAPGYKTEHESLLIKRLIIPVLDANGTGTGTISFFEKAETEKTACVVKVAGSALHIEAGPNSWDFNIYKASGTEFIFGKPGGLMYFAKKL